MNFRKSLGTGNGMVHRAWFRLRGSSHNHIKTESYTRVSRFIMIFYNCKENCNLIILIVLHISFRGRGSVIMVNGKFDEWFKDLGDSVENITKMPRPRYIKTHLPWDLLPRQFHEKKPKVMTQHIEKNRDYSLRNIDFCTLQIIYVTRNPKDICVSYYYYCQTFHGMNGSFDDFAKLMLRDSGTLSNMHYCIRIKLDYLGYHKIIFLGCDV